MEGEHRGHQAPAWYLTCNYRVSSPTDWIVDANIATSSAL